ncbi:uncharacterized protein LOC102807014, partial [Saccoglossus kowalevskii]|uniref:Uncharacterized protein LOC102807014 n=1 Tax=Saccoglossus kowalevskii TaxID=10224 RepID=A0ABM0MYH8_SACKO
MTGLGHTEPLQTKAETNDESPQPEKCLDGTNCKSQQGSDIHHETINANKLIVGDSITRHVKASKMFPRTSVDHRKIYTIAQAIDAAKVFISPSVDTVVYHIGTNDLMSGKSPAECIDQMVELVDTTTNNMPNANIVISDVLKRHNNKNVNDNVQEFNLLLFNKMKLRKKVTIVKHNELSANSELFDDD